ncbi:hypothetical protein ACTWP5_17665 [Streptomyces sp. 4N509B]|uniref:hypothetical protein n=1 Tax=Streptomyces sp. 4N509B TaxID=3457413 RepID=UPI003FCF629E
MTEPVDGGVGASPAAPPPAVVPTEILVSAWGLDAAALARALLARVGRTRLFLAGRLADDLATAHGPAQIVALTDHTQRVQRTTFPRDGLVPCPVPLTVTVLPLGVVREWSAPLVSLLTGPAPVLRRLPPRVATGLHALYTQRDLRPGDDHLAEELESTHVEVLPMYQATWEVHALRHPDRAGAPPSDLDRLAGTVRALLGAWGHCTPDPEALVPLFDRAADGLGVPGEIPRLVRRALRDGGGAGEAAVGPALRAVTRLAAGDPLLRRCEELAAAAALAGRYG